jgi:hypothetical protein
MYTGNPDLWQPSFNDEDEALLIAAAEPVEAHEDNTAVSDISISIPEDIPGTPHSHDVEPCLGDRGHGQGLPAYPCGCYIHPKVNFGPALTDSDVCEQHSEPKGLEQVQWSPRDLLVHSILMVIVPGCR